ncbi:TetR/AcrR family transcriptional regulator [Kribbella sp. NPDC051587]|uniref:TetR/AcrR family transcriptional regulator n=1 Tax=Kribbella sp. NPDC051587 TaxID=3364119 RepID=UPI003788C149
MYGLSDEEPAPVRGRRTPRVSGDDREQAILDAAHHLLGEKPLQAISVEELTRIVGISRPAFYFYFSSKADVVLALLDRIAQASFEAADRRYENADGDPFGLWHSGILASVRTWTEHRAVIEAVAQLRPGHPQIRDLWALIMERWVQRVAAAIEREREGGMAPAGVPARELAIALSLMNERAMHATSVGDEPALTQDRLVDSLTQIWVNAIYLTANPPRVPEAEAR